MSVIVPAHDEARSIGRLLTALTSNPGQGDRSQDLDIVVVCNGCTDDTAQVARTHDRDGSIRVMEIPVPSKMEALRAGAAVAQRDVRVFLDADVVVDAASLAAMRRTMESAGALACGPVRVFPWEGVSRWVRWYYEVWQELPQVRSGLFGRGVLMVAPAGMQRLDLTTDLLSDDLAMSEAFAPAERVVAQAARVVIRPPKTLADLLRRRVRVAMGNTQADAEGIRSVQARTGIGDLLGVALRDPRQTLKLPVFLAITLIARTRATRQQTRGNATTWLRDESSRA